MPLVIVIASFLSLLRAAGSDSTGPGSLILVNKVKNRLQTLGLLDRTLSVATDDDVVALDQGLARYAGEPVLREAGVEDGIRDAVGDLVRVALADGFGREDEGGVACHKTGETNGGRRGWQVRHPNIWIGRCVIGIGLWPIPMGGSGWRLAVRGVQRGPEAAPRVDLLTGGPVGQGCTAQVQKCKSAYGLCKGANVEGKLQVTEGSR